MAQYLKGDSPESKSFNVLLKRILFPGIVHRSLAVLSSVLLLSESVTATPKQFSTHSEGGWGGGSSLAQQPGATEIEANRAAAERAYEEGVQLYQQGTAESLQQAITKFVEVLPVLRAEGKKAGEAYILSFIGYIYSNLGEKQKALSFFNQALPLSRVTGDKAIEATILYNLACMERDRGNLKVALTQMEAAIKIFEDLDTNIASQERRDSYFASLQSYSNRQDG
jgi:tetratricopeptide (TPR) repeat protein